MSMKEHFIQECVKLFRRDDVKLELKKIMHPFIGLLLQELYPYIFLSLLFVIIGFLLILGIFTLLVRKKTFSQSIV